MENKTIITVNRQFGGGGREVGKKIANRLEIPFYNKEFIEITAEESDTDKKLFEEGDARTSRGSRLLGALGYSLGRPLFAITELSLNNHLYLVQEEVVKGVTREGSCVIVGCCADYILRDRSGVLNVYIHADVEDRKERAIHSYEVDERDIRGSIKKIDKRRANYYEYYTDHKWNRAEDCDVNINSSMFGIDGTVEIIKMLAQKKIL